MCDKTEEEFALINTTYKNYRLKVSQEDYKFKATGQKGSKTLSQKQRTGGVAQW
jgi:hypothetical protein